MGLGEGGEYVIPEYVKSIAADLTVFIVEYPKSARHYLKSIGYKNSFDEVKMITINKHSDINDIQSSLMSALNGTDIGLLSDAGCPSIADPGAWVVDMAHEQQIDVVPLVGPSSILLALMGSGMNGQNFAFMGYLPIKEGERKKVIKEAEQKSLQQTQIFIETPYRNDGLLKDLIQNCNKQTKLCIATNLTLPNEYIQTKTIEDWRKTSISLKNKPCVFLLGKTLEKVSGKYK